MGNVSTTSPTEPEGITRFGHYQSLQNDGQMLAVRLIKLLHRMADRSGMNPTDFQCYTLLRVAGTMTPGEIAASLCLSTGSVTGVIDRMEAHGLVERTRHPEDRRKVAVRLTEGADGINAAFAPGMRRAMTELHDGYSSEELSVIVDWLGRVGRTLDHLSEKP
ncbi:DNA-binding transcriptional regulator, MarR family [Nocardiopsis flavescens]|uniref:DNA-binding transcriptional regulator, MarR family n=2 Tax=Nocardiopsis flavescens TaxID=758803 RepID=A0A1M6IG64_9ACTN|nr:DNA-binding transcriptional regulator, MarR family [Nocardiopsis flavescens]